jgi:hypothetical protein
MKSGGEMTDTIEIAIPFALIGLNGVTLPAVIGLSLEVTNTFSAWEYWPSTASIDAPSSWGNAVLQAPTASVHSRNASPICLKALSDWRFRAITTGALIERVEIRDILGRSLKDVTPVVRVTQIDIDLSEFPSGHYFILVETSSGRTVEKLLLSR